MFTSSESYWTLDSELELELEALREQLVLYKYEFAFKTQYFVIDILLNVVYSSVSL